MLENRALPLKEIAKQGRFGADRGQPGVVLSVLHPRTMALVIARKGQSNSVAAGLKSIKAALKMPAGPDQFLVDGIAPKELKRKLGQSASVIDQSHGRVSIRISGPRARDVLARGTPVDLHADHFPVGKSVMTQMAHVGVHITRTAEDEFTLSVFRGFSESFWEALTHAAEQFGYQVT